MDIRQNYKHLQHWPYFVPQRKTIDKTSNGKNLELKSLELVEVVLVHGNLVDKQYQQKSEVLYTFMPNKAHTYLLNVETSNLMFLKFYNTKFNYIAITFTVQNGRPLEIEDRVNLILPINK